MHEAGGSREKDGFAALEQTAADLGRDSHGHVVDLCGFRGRAAGGDELGGGVPGTVHLLQGMEEQEEATGNGAKF